MIVILLAIYIVVIFIRPMEWWQPIYNWQIVNYLAILLMPASVITAPKEVVVRWWKLPESKLAIIVLILASTSNFFVWYPLILTTFQEFGKIILLYTVMLLVMKKEENFRFIIWTIFICIAWLAIHGFLQIQRGYGFGGLAPIWRPADNVYQIMAFGIFNDPNDLCLVFIVALPLLYSEFRITSDAIIKIISLGMMVMFLTAAWLTNSRGGIIGIFGMVASYIILRMKGPFRWITILAMGGLIFIFAPARFASTSSVDISRVSLWGIGLTVFKEHPIFGVGYHNFADYSGSMMAHNSYIQVLAELGILGYIPWFLLLFFTITHVSRTFNFSSSISKNDSHHLLGLFSALSGYLMANYFLSRSYDYLLFILLALAAVKILIVADKYGLHKEIFGDRIADLKRGIIFGFISIGIIYSTVRIANIVGGRPY